MSLFYKIFYGSLMLCLTVQAKQSISQYDTPKPKLVVAIVVDQMRYDYLPRFYNRLGQDGFKRLIQNGFNCKNHHINYIPTTTAPGHASIFTGTTPKNHGIIGNSWYNRSLDQKTYCVVDDKVSPVGTSSYEGKKSPSKLLTTTIADQNRLHTQMRGKTISISIKDRAAILSGGHTASAAYWFRGKDQGSWISSSYYLNTLPNWVTRFNESYKADSYFRTWDTLHEITSYSESGEDDTAYERGFRGKEKPIFPYDLDTLKKFNGEYDIIKHTPFGNSLTTDFAIAAIKEERLGKDTDTDFLIISFSSTDYIGHNFGVNSKEIEDAYLRLDTDIARLLNVLDKEVGNNDYLLFLTSDHGASQVPKYLNTLDVPSGYFKEASIHIGLKNYIYAKYKIKDIIKTSTNNQVYLNTQLIQEEGLNAVQIQQEIVRYLLKLKDIDQVFTRDNLKNNTYTFHVSALLQNGFHLKRSGDVVYTLAPSTMAYSKTGSSHGSGYTYDTHVPLLFYGTNIKAGETYRKTVVSDISHTLAFLLNISLPNGSSGKTIKEIIP